MITLESVTKTYTLSQDVTVTAVRGVSLEVARGEFVIITGRSGSGKTTLLNLAAGLTRPTAGRVLWERQDLWRIGDRRRSRLRNRQVGFVFQFPSLLPSLTVIDNVLAPSLFSPDGAHAELRERARELLDSVGLGPKANVYPRQLSAGQQQRVVIARALFNRPQILLADEPTSDLDEHTEEEIMTLFSQIHAQAGMTVVLVTHTRQLIHYGTRAIHMVDGQMVDH
jgi:ABC-type lipoprotein export system ATPase subunit